MKALHPKDVGKRSITHNLDHFLDFKVHHERFFFGCLKIEQVKGQESGGQFSKIAIAPHPKEMKLILIQ